MGRRLPPGSRPEKLPPSAEPGAGHRALARSASALPFVSLSALLALLLAAALPPGGVGLLLCPFRTLTGVPCAGCGLTRSVIQAARGEWVAALRLHPLGPALCLALLSVALSGLMPREWRAALLARLRRPALLRAACVATIGVLLVNELFRLLWIFGWHRPSLW
jgi:Protein of unknown function (DUF2752)